MSIEFLKWRRYSFFLILLFPISGKAQVYYEYNRTAQDIYQQIMDLQLDEANQQLISLERQEPNNLVVFHLKNYLNFFSIYTSDDEQLYKQLRPNRDLYLKALQSGSDQSPWHLYVQADIRLQWALLKFQFGDYLAGFWDVKKAYNLLTKNLKRHPDFLPTYKDLGILHALIGNVPDQYKWGVKNLAGLNGTIQQGKEEITRSLKDKNPETNFFREETVMIFSYLLLYLDKDPSAAWQVLKQYPLRVDQHILEAFTYASVAARCGKNETAIKTLSKAQGFSSWEQFPFLEFRLGELKLRKLDPAAAQHFERFIQKYQGGKDIKAAYLRLAWTALIQNDQKGYRKYCQKIKANGKVVTGRDKDAVFTCELGFIPNVDLIKARLLFDGGYYLKALKLVNQYQEKDFNSIYEKLDWLYRKARLEQQIKNHDAALNTYYQVWQRGAQQSYYFACNAALQMGLIYEQQHEYEQAKKYFKTCLSLHPDIYQNSLHLAAKAGLQRLKK